MRKPKDAAAKQPRRAKASNTLTVSLSELLRSLGGILGDAYADDAAAPIVTNLETAKDAILNARKAATAEARS